MHQNNWRADSRIPLPIVRVSFRLASNDRCFRLRLRPRALCRHCNNFVVGTKVFTETEEQVSAGIKGQPRQTVVWIIATGFQANQRLDVITLQIAIGVGAKKNLAASRDEDFDRRCLGGNWFCRFILSFLRLCQSKIQPDRFHSDAHGMRQTVVEDDDVVGPSVLIFIPHHENSVGRMSGVAFGRKVCVAFYRPDSSRSIDINPGWSDDLRRFGKQFNLQPWIHRSGPFVLSNRLDRECLVKEGRGKTDEQREPYERHADSPTSLLKAMEFAAL
jgi:hypothetical protein